MTSSGISPLERVHRFIDELRARGMPVSMVERLDAMRAAEIAELDQADGLRTALRCTLISRPTISASSRRCTTSTSARGASGRLPQQASLARPGHCWTWSGRSSPCCATAQQELARQVAEQAVGEFVQFEAGRPVAGVMYERATLAGLRLEELAARQQAEAAGGPADPALPVSTCAWSSSGRRSPPGPST